MYVLYRGPFIFNQVRLPSSLPSIFDARPDIVHQMNNRTRGVKVRHPSSHGHTLLDQLDFQKVLFPFYYLKFKVNYLTLSVLVSLSGFQTT